MRTHHQPAPWTMRKLRALLAAGVAAAVGVLAGVVLALTHTHTTSDRGVTTPSAPTPIPSTGGPTDARDALAARTMPTFGLDAGTPQPVSLRNPAPPIVLPRATAMGDAEVSTGFPYTVEGAMAQLAAIDTAALEPASLDRAGAVVAAWSSPGGPDPATWSVIRALAALLNATGVGSGSGQLTITLTPVMGLVKGSVGADFVIPCVDFEIDVTVTQTARAAIADCARMVWADGRWRLGPGSEPADPPAVWPDTDLAFQVGYRDVRHG